MPGVGSTPARITSAPSAQIPATNAASSIGPGTTRVVAHDERLPGAEHADGGAAERGDELDGELVFATPRTPSVPKRRVMATRSKKRSALRVLRSLSGLLEAVLAPLLLAVVHV